MLGFEGENAREKVIVLLTMCFALAMAMLDNTVVNVALPSIQRHLGAGFSELQWVVDGYVLALESVFFLNVPIGIAALSVAVRTVTESVSEVERQLDVWGLVLGTAALFFVTYGLIEANQLGWGSARIVGSFALFAVFLVTFLWWELRNP